MHGGSPVRSASEEVDDGPTSSTRSGDHGPTDDPRGAPWSAQGGVEFMKRIGMARVLVAVAAIGIVAGACSSPAASGGGASAAAGGAKYTIGFANGAGTGNGWREASICSAKAQAAASGEVKSVTVIHHDVDAAGQLADIRDLIAKNVNAIVVNPQDPNALNDGIKEATDKGIVVVSIDASVTAPTAYNLSNDQEQYAYLGASWLFKQLNGKGAVIYMRGVAGHPADTDRDTGFKKALAENPGITVAKEVATKWDPATATTQINDILASGTKFDGIWTSGVDASIVDALKTANHPQVPIVGADNAGFVNQLLTMSDLKGAAVTNPAAVGGAGVALALQILDGKKPSATTVHVTPEEWDNSTASGKASLQAAADPSLPKEWPLGLTIKDWTTYDKPALIACKGPGE
jgi:ribose transport system substrate-binding protein